MTQWQHTVLQFLAESCMYRHLDMHATYNCVVYTGQAKAYVYKQQKAKAHLSNLLTRDKLPIAAPDSRCRAAQVRDLVKAAMRAVSRALLCSSSICCATHNSSTTCGRSWLAGWLVEGSDVLSAIRGWCSVCVVGQRLLGCQQQQNMAEAVFT